MKTRWYKDAVFYQIYPRSFCDSNGDGIGDLQGIISKLDYLVELGVTAVWLSPIYTSPNDDNGYDISNYRDINPEFGTLDDFKEMIAEMHKRGIKLVMDLVVNHTSDEHNWFEESRKSKDNPYRDYYIWRKGRDGKKPPNNWTSRFTGSAWKYDSTTDEWFLHLFSAKQPDLNWDNPKVRQEVIDISNYWLEMGVDGFRCDVITYVSKNKGLPMGKFNPVTCGDEHFVLGEHFHEYMQQLNQESWSKYDTMIVGECIGVNMTEVEPVVAEHRGELDSAITFELMESDMFMGVIPMGMKLKKFKAVQSGWQNLPRDCWNTLYYENHDQPRSVSRYGEKNTIYRKELAKMLAVSLHFLRGTPYVYQGQELGMGNIKLKEEEYEDIASKQVFQMIRKYFRPALFVAKWVMARRARDHARTPMQWTGEKGAGFTSSKAWMKINPEYTTVNAEAEAKNPNSVLSFYKKLIAFRKGNEIIRDGEYKEYSPNNGNVYAYERSLGNKRYIIVCNFKNKTVNYNAVDMGARDGELVMSNYATAPKVCRDGMTLSPYEARVYYCTRNSNYLLND